MKQIGLLPAFAHSKVSGNGKRYADDTTTAPYLFLSCLAIAIICATRSNTHIYNGFKLIVHGMRGTEIER
jgi:hypothetical protein